MHNVEPIEWTKLEVSGTAASSWVGFMWCSWDRVMHFNIYIWNEIKAATLCAVFLFLSDTKWHVKPTAVDCSRVEPVPTITWNKNTVTAFYVKPIHADCVLHEANPHWLLFAWSQFTLTAFYIKPFHTDWILHEANPHWLHFTWSQSTLHFAWSHYQMAAVAWSQYQLTAVIWIQYILTACHMKPVRNFLSCQANTYWMHTHEVNICWPPVTLNH